MLEFVGESVIVALTFILLSMLVIWRASAGFESASEYIGRNLTDGVRGATINAIASSIPEVLTTFFFLLILKDVEGFSGGLGTTAGSAIFNSMIIPSCVVLVVFFTFRLFAFEVSKKVILRDGIALIICESILILLLSSQSQLTWWHGLILISLYVAYMFVMFYSMRTAIPQQEVMQEDDEPSEQNEPNVQSWIKALLTLDLERVIIGNRVINGKIAWSLLLISTLIIAIGCFILVDATEALSRVLGVPIYIIAVLLAAAATSVPDTVISIRDAAKGNYDDAISNALGSNVFDITIALGLPLFIYGLFYDPISIADSKDISELRFILLFLTILAFLTYVIGKRMNVFKSILLVSFFVVFVTYILGKSFYPSHPIIELVSGFFSS